MKRVWAVVLCAGVQAACSSTDDGPSAEETLTAAHEDSVQFAAAAYDPANYDTIEWENRTKRLERGATVFRISCAKCHGYEGRGDGGFVQRGDTLRPPSFLESEWRFARDIDGLREQIYTGTSEGMPHWGLYGLKYRDVDAVSAYIAEELRG